MLLRFDGKEWCLGLLTVGSADSPQALTMQTDSTQTLTVGSVNNPQALTMQTDSISHTRQALTAWTARRH